MSQVNGGMCPLIPILSADPAVLQAGDQIQNLWNTINTINNTVNNLVIQNNTNNSPAGTTITTIASVVETPTGIKGATRDITVLSSTALSSYSKLGLIPFTVRVTQSGGSAGSITTQCSFTYNVFEQDGVTAVKTTRTGSTNATSRTVVGHQRPIIGKMEAGTYGIAYYDASDALVLQWVNECKYGPTVVLASGNSVITLDTSSTPTLTTPVTGVLVVPATGIYLVDAHFGGAATWNFVANSISTAEIVLRGVLFNANSSANAYDFGFTAYGWANTASSLYATRSTYSPLMSLPFSGSGTVALTAGHSLTLRAFISKNSFGAGDLANGYVAGATLKLTLLSS